MNCKDISKLFTAYLDGEVTSEEQIQAHLSACQYCRKELEALATTQNSLRQALKVTAAGATPSPQAWAGLQQRLEAEEQPRVTIWGLAKSKVKGGIDIMIQGLIRGLTSRQPVWKTAVASILAPVLIVGPILAIPPLTSQSPAELAASIVDNCPEVQAALGGEEVKVMKMLEAVDGKKTVLIWVETGLVSVEVDLGTKEVTEVVHVPAPEFTAADEQKAINIAKADPRVQELLNQGATISRVSPGHAIGVREILGPDGEIVHREGVVEPMAAVYLKLGEETWYAIIYLATEEVHGVDRVPDWFDLERHCVTLPWIKIDDILWTKIGEKS